MSDFVVSQILIAIAICFDIISFQLRDRRYILLCLVCAGLLISAHFYFLGNLTAMWLLLISVSRYFTSIFTTSRWLAFFFIAVASVSTFLTYNGFQSLISLTGASFQTLAAFHKKDQQMRQLMIVGVSFWLIHNILAESPGAVIMEVIFLTSNLIGYYRFYIYPKTS